ncbi:MAG: phosphohistidine phosphatase, partial [Patiriisocius sp.]
NVYIENLPTCGFVAIKFKEDTWSKIKGGSTIKTVFPRDLK